MVFYMNKFTSYTNICIRMLKLIKQRIAKNTFILAVFIAIIGSSGNALQGVFNRYFCEKTNIHTFQLLTIRCLIEIILFLPFSIKNLKTLKKDYLIVLILAGLYSCDILLYHTGLQTVSVNTGTLIMMLVPFWMVLFSKLILKEKNIHIASIITLFVCAIAVGYSIIGEMHFNGFTIGIVFIMANSIILPIGVILQKKFTDTRPTHYAIFTNAILLAIVGYFLSYSTTKQLALPINIQTIKASFIVSIFDVMECAGVYVSCRLANIASLQSIRFTRFVFASIFSSMVLGQYITKYQAISGLVIFSANLVAFVLINNKNKKNQTKTSL